MKKSLIIFAALPVLFGAGGYAAGTFMAPKEKSEPAHQETATDDRSDAEKTLDKLANDTPHDAKDDHGAHPAKDSHAPAQHDAKLIPAKADGPADTHASDNHAAAKPKGSAKDTHAKADHAAKPKAANQAAAMTADNPVGRAAPPPRVAGNSRATPQEVGGAKMTKADLKDAKVVKLGRMTIPVQRARSVTYVVSDIGVSVADLETAAHFNVAENASRLRDAILVSMHRAAGTSVMKGPSIDTQELSDTLSADLKHDFGSKVDEVLFLTMFKADVPRS